MGGCQSWWCKTNIITRSTVKTAIHESAELGVYLKEKATPVNGTNQKINFK